VGFQVEIVYATAIDPLGFAGFIEGALPVPDIVETRSTWDVFLPEELSYARVDANMTVAIQNGAFDLATEQSAEFQVAVGGHDRSAAVLVDGPTGASGRLSGERPSGVLPLQIEVPRRGVHFQFEKLFANRGEERSRFSIRYTTAAAGTSGGGLLVLGVLALAVVFASWLGLGRKLSTGACAALALTGMATVVFSTWFLGASLVWAAAAAAAAALGLTAMALLKQKEKRSIGREAG